mmetsp:Transcript_6634/g.8682  ORF Transcript_6634/g.8682 Transcript_6634/m.8682 type:complete len:190 (+) Transcript_6634:99-668(+)
MSEESKTAEGDYVNMGSGTGLRTGAGVQLTAGLDDPNLSQEDKDMRLAIALQQQENAAVYEQRQKQHAAHKKADTFRTMRSGTHTRLAAIRDKDQGMLQVPAEYSTENAYKATDGEYVSPPGEAVSSLKGALPQEVADHNLALELQKVEQVGAGTGQTLDKIVRDEKKDSEADERRNARSGHWLPKGSK